jgi:hypothetical protein
MNLLLRSVIEVIWTKHSAVITVAIFLYIFVFAGTENQKLLFTSLCLLKKISCTYADSSILIDSLICTGTNKETGIVKQASTLPAYHSRRYKVSYCFRPIGLNADPDPKIYLKADPEF